MKKLKELMTQSDSLFEVTGPTVRREDAGEKAGKWTFFSLKNSNDRVGRPKSTKHSSIDPRIRYLALAVLGCEKSMALEDALKLKGYSEDEVRNWGWVVNYDDNEKLLGVLDATVDPVLLAACISCKIGEPIAAIKAHGEAGILKATYFDANGRAEGMIQAGGSSPVQLVRFIKDDVKDMLFKKMVG